MNIGQSSTAVPKCVGCGELYFHGHMCASRPWARYPAPNDARFVAFAPPFTSPAPSEKDYRIESAGFNNLGPWVRIESPDGVRRGLTTEGARALFLALGSAKTEREAQYLLEKAFLAEEHLHAPAPDA